MTIVVRIALPLLLLLLVAHPAQASTFGHAAWHELLQRHVVELRGGQATQVDYAGLRRDRAKLGKYLAATSVVSRADKDAIPSVGQGGLTQKDVDILYRGAAKYLDSGRCSRIEYADKSTSKPNTYYVNCGGPQNFFFTPADL